MTSSSDIRGYLRSNPGWHLLREVCDALGLTGKDRYAAGRTVGVMKLRGMLKSEGRPGQMRYQLAREARPKIAIKRVAKPAEGE